MNRYLFLRVLSRQAIGWYALQVVLLGGMACAFFPSIRLVSATDLPQERELYNTLPGNNQQDSILDATNPMEFLNKLRRATAMDDATSPSDAIDEALKAFEETDQDD